MRSISLGVGLVAASVLAFALTLGVSHLLSAEVAAPDEVETRLTIEPGTWIAYDDAQWVPREN